MVVVGSGCNGAVTVVSVVDGGMVVGLWWCITVSFGSNEVLLGGSGLGGCSSCCPCCIRSVSSSSSLMFICGGGRSAPVVITCGSEMMGPRCLRMSCKASLIASSYGFEFSSPSPSSVLLQLILLVEVLIVVIVCFVGCGCC